ncbi:MAG: ribonuclease III domain-containing protein [Ruminococcus sp.]
MALVCAGFQATVMRELLPTLTEEEQAVFLRGRNAAPKHAHQAEYRYATGLEALFGYLYLTGAADRMQALMQQIRQTAAFQAVLTADAAENQSKG